MGSTSASECSPAQALQPEPAELRMTFFSPHKPLLATQLIGRATPLATLHEALQIVPQRRGACVLLAGEAGIGKSRLTAEARMLAQQNGFAIIKDWHGPDQKKPLERLFCLRSRLIIYRNARPTRGLGG